MKRSKETRVFKFESLKIEERSDGLGPKIVGYAAIFNKWSDDLGGFREKINQGAFRKALKISDARGLFNHDSNYVLGRQSNGTLRIKEDKKGLWMEIDPPDTQIIRDLVIAPIKRGDIKEQSFGFIVADDKWENLDGEKKDDPISRTIIEIKELFDVSPVTFPAYPDTSVALRSMENAKESSFNVADESDVLNNHVMHYLEPGDETRKTLAAYDIISMLLPKITDEQRLKLIPTSEPDAKPPGNDDGIIDDGSGNDGITQREKSRDPKQIDIRHKEVMMQ